MEEVGWWEDPREGFILTQPYIARRHVRQTKLPGVREQLGFTHKPYKYGTRHVRQHFFSTFLSADFDSYYLFPVLVQRRSARWELRSQGLWLVGPAIDVGFFGDLTAAVKALTLVQGQGFHCGCNDLIHVLEAYYFKQKKAALLSVTL